MLPSDPQERQDGWYWVRGEYTHWLAALWIEPAPGSSEKGWMVANSDIISEIGQRIPSPDEQAPPIERPEELKDPEAQLERLRGVEFGDLRSYAVLARDSLRYVLALEAECSRLRADNKRLANHPAEGEKI